MGVYLNKVFYSVDIKRPPPLPIFQGQSDVSREFRTVALEICVILPPIWDIESIFSFLPRKNIYVKRCNPFLIILLMGVR